MGEKSKTKRILGEINTVINFPSPEQPRSRNEVDRTVGGI